jgi:hypothetical protein
MLQNPRKVGQRYQEYLQGLLRLHGIFDWFVLTDPAQVTVEDVARQADELVTSNLRRISRSTRLRKSKGSMVFGWLFARSVRVTGFCRAINIDLARQTETIFHNSRSFRL